MDKLPANHSSKTGEIRLPHLDGPTEIYTLTAWHAQVGEAIEAPRIIATIETPSFTLEVEAFDSGTLANRFFNVGDPIPDGAILAQVV